MMSGATREIWHMPHMSQEFERGPEVSLAGGKLTVRYDYETVQGPYAWSGFAFDEVQAFEFVGERLCQEEQFAALDKVVEVTKSSWESRARTNVSTGHDARLRHYRIYFDDYGCLEILANAFIPPEGASER